MLREDWFDKAFDRFCAFFEKLVSKNIDDHWFRWLEWIVVTSALYAVGRKTGSILIIAVTCFSTLLLIFRAWVTAQQLLKSYIASLSSCSKFRLISAILLFFVVSACPVIVISFLAQVFVGLIK